VQFGENAGFGVILDVLQDLFSGRIRSHGFLERCG
jgi:hypothetical protein